MIPIMIYHHKSFKQLTREYIFKVSIGTFMSWLQDDPWSMIQDHYSMIQDHYSMIHDYKFKPVNVIQHVLATTTFCTWEKKPFNSLC